MSFTTNNQEVLAVNSIFGLALYGKVTNVPGANQFTIPNLAGRGADAFLSPGANPWQAFVLRTHGGVDAAPQSEQQPITAYDTATGIFTTAAYTVAVAAGDEVVLINPNLANAAVLVDLLLVKVQTDKVPKMTFDMPAFVSSPQARVTVPAVAATLALPSVIVAGIPAGALVTKAHVKFKFRTVRDTSVAENNLSGATVAATSQVIQIKKGAGAWNDCMDFVNTQYDVLASGEEAGEELTGAIDVSAFVTGNDTYSFQWLLAKAVGANLLLLDAQLSIELSYTL